jgi:hypothetical protein
MTQSNISATRSNYGKTITDVHACRGRRAFWAAACGSRGASGGPRQRLPQSSRRESRRPSPRRSGTPPRPPWLRLRNPQLQSTKRTGESNTRWFKEAMERGYIGRAGRGWISQELRRRRGGGGAREMHTREPWDGGERLWEKTFPARRARRSGGLRPARSGRAARPKRSSAVGRWERDGVAGRRIRGPPPKSCGGA